MNNIKIAKGLIKVARELVADTMPSEISAFLRKLNDYAYEMSQDDFGEKHAIRKYMDLKGGVYSLIKNFIKGNGAKDIEIEVQWHSGAIFKCTVGNYNVRFLVDGKNKYNHGGWADDKTIKVIGYDVKIRDFKYIDSSIVNLTKDKFVGDYIDKRIDFLNNQVNSLKNAIAQYASRATEKDKQRVQNMLGGGKSNKQIFSELEKVKSNKSKLLPRLSLLLQSKEGMQIFRRSEYMYPFTFAGDAFSGDFNTNEDLGINTTLVFRYFVEPSVIEKRIAFDANDKWGSIAKMQLHK